MSLYFRDCTFIELIILINWHIEILIYSNHLYIYIIICKIIVRQIFNLQNIYLFYNPWFERWKQTKSFIYLFFNLRTILVIHATYAVIQTVFCWNVARLKTFNAVERSWDECALLTTESEIFEALSDDAATFAFQTSAGFQSRISHFLVHFSGIFRDNFVYVVITIDKLSTS